MGPDSPLHIHFLGTNGWYDTVTGNTISILIETSSHFIILDAGNGLYKIDQYIKTEKPIYLFLSHFHLDHIEGLHILNKFKFPQGLTIVGQTGASDILNRIIDKPYTVPFSELPFRVDIQEIAEGHHSFPFSVQCRYLVHSSPTLGFRFNLDGRVVSYCPDTGYCKNAVKLAANADILIAECALKIGEKSAAWPHLNPETAARLAREAQVKQLALVHFDADRYRTLAERDEAQKAAQKIFQRVIATRDGMELEI